MCYVAAVAERLVFGFPAPAERDPVPDRIPFSVGRFNRDAATHPERPVIVPGRIFNDHDGLFEFGSMTCPVFLSLTMNRPDGQLLSSSITVSRALGVLDFLVRFQMPPARMQNRA